MAGVVQAQVTYHLDVAPIIHNACTECHRAGEIGPMPFTTYDEVAAYGAFIEYVTCLLYTSPSPRDATLSRMPSSA